MKRPARILLVEDDDSEVTVVLRALAKAGIDVSIDLATDGAEALDRLGLKEREVVGVPSVVFLDLKMPRVDGWEVLRRMRENPRTADVPVVVLSASDREEDIRRSYQLGANSFLQKRFDPRGPGRYFVDAVRYWLDLNLDPNGG